MLSHAPSATRRLWSRARVSEPETLLQQCLSVQPRRTLSTIASSSRTLSGAQNSMLRAASVPVMFTRHRSKYIRDEESLADWEDRQHLHEVMSQPKLNERAEEHVVGHMCKIFAPLKFPADLAMRMITHASYRGGQYGHNTRLSFLGRRTLQSYLRLFVLSASAPTPESSATDALCNPFQFPFEDLDDWCDDVLNTYKLGEHVGGAWALENIMQWTPAIIPRQEGRGFLHGSGLYKVRGTAVESIIGGIYHQHGGTVALRAFHTRVLPHLQIFLKEPLRSHARLRLEQMGGKDGLLTSEQVQTPIEQQQQRQPNGIQHRSSYRPPPLKRHEPSEAARNRVVRPDAASRDIREQIRAILG
ncbi:ribonuclease-III-like-domain-containing protein [Auriculariales sp. MPI-PUGE-AT-0066]|nr:ribonuclease-III-like-domain-containing protein [Auriculariales sp. MPI-PUGE-AT-0066]